MEVMARIVDETREDAAATIAVALFYLKREAQATGLEGLAGLIERAVEEATLQAGSPAS